MLRKVSRLLQVGLAAICTLLLVFGCSPEESDQPLKSSVENPTDSLPDESPPSRVQDLSISDIGRRSVTLSWTAPRDSDSGGTAFDYDIRYSRDPITDSTWDEAATCENEPVPTLAGSIQSMVVGGLTPGTEYSLAMMTADSMANWSDLSNVVLATTGPYLDSMNQLTFEGGISSIDWSIDNVIYYASGGDIYRIDSDGTKAINITCSPSRGKGRVTVSSDGLKIAYMAADVGAATTQLYMADSDGGNEAMVGGPLVVAYCWSPKGQAMALFAQGWMWRSLYVLDFGSGGTHELMFSVGDIWIDEMSWSHDKIIASYWGTAAVIDTVTGDYRYLGLDISNPNWSGDGSRFLCIVEEDIYLVNADSTGGLNLTDTPSAAEAYPSFSPDGSWIAFVRDGNIFKAFYPEGSLLFSK